MKAEGQLLDLAASVADGAQVDWQAAETGTEEQARRLVRHLRLVADVAELYRSLPDAPPQTTFIVDEPTPEGRRWGRLVLLEKIGEGTSSEVYRAFDPELQREVALKLLRADGTEAEAARWRMLGEARRLARVRHPHVVLVYGADRREDRVGLWMEFVDGATLDSLVQKSGLLSAREAALIGVDVCRALAAVHAAGLVHRDVKAQNVIRESGGRIVLMDFGTGEEIQRVEGRAIGQIAGQAARGGPRLAGTPLYLAPEILAGGAASARSDLYSLGVLLFYLVTRQFPIAARTFEDLVKAHGERNLRRLRDLRPDLPDAFVHAVERALASAPAARFQSAGAMESALRESLATTEPAAAVSSTAAPTVNAARWWKPAVLIGLAATIAIVAMFLVNWPSPSSRQPIDQIAILPLSDRSGGSAPPYLADALTDELITTLGQIRSLRVTSATSVSRFRNAAEPAGEIGRSLGVDAVLEASISRAASARPDDRGLTVTARLLATGTGRELWAKAFETRSGSPADLAAQLARAMADGIRVAVRSDEATRLRHPRQTIPAAEEAYFRGRWHLKQFGVSSSRLAANEFERAIQLDPAHAPAQAGLSRAYIALGFSGALAHQEARQRAIGHATRALALDPALAEAHEVMGDLRFFYDWDWENAELEYQRALDANPSSAGRSAYARYLAAAGRVTDAVAEATRAREVDPLSPEAAQTLALMHYYARDYDDANQLLEQARSLDPSLGRVWIVWARVHEAQGRFDEGIAATERALALVAQPSPSWVAVRARLEGLNGNAQGARTRLDRLAAEDAKGAVRIAPQHLAYVHLALGERQAALRLLTRAVAERDPEILWIGVDPRLDALRGDPDFEALADRVRPK